MPAITNINFIASYIFRYPGCSAVDVRRALFFNKHRTLDGFCERRWAHSYFYMPKNHRGYPKKYWKSPKRGQWIITPEGLDKALYNNGSNGGNYDYSGNKRHNRLQGIEISNDGSKLYDFATGSYFSPYITTVGMYNEQMDLLAVGKLAQPLPSSRTTDTTILVNIDR